MSDIDDPSTPRFFSKQKNELDDILSDIDNDLSDDVLDIESFDDMPAEPLKASKPFGASKKSFGKSSGGSNFGGGASFSRKGGSSKLLMGTILAVLVVAGAGGAYYFLNTGDSYSTPKKIAAPLAPPPSENMIPPMADGAMPSAPGMPTVPGVPGQDAGTPPDTMGATIPALPNDPNAPITSPADGTSPQDSLLPQVASDVAPPVSATTDAKTDAKVTTPTDPTKIDPAKTAEATPATTPVTADATLPPAVTADASLPPLPQDGIIAPKADVTGATTVTPEDTTAKVATDTSKTSALDASTALQVESKTDKVTKPSGKPEAIKYFDSPPGEVLEDIQPPSIDVTRNPGESIIIVKKAPGYDSGYVDGAYSQKGDGSVRIERSEAGNGMSQKAVMADRALRLGRYDMALNYFQDILAQNPNDVSALLGRAIALQKSGNVDAAMQGYRDVLRRDQSNVTAATNLAGLQSKSSPNDALKNLSNVYSSDPSNTNVKAQMGVSMAQSGNAEDAYNVFLGATKTDPQNPVHYFNLAVTAEKLGRRAEAIAAYEKCLEIDAIYGTGRGINRDIIYDRLAKIRG